jgi:hypothetical protein
VRRLLLFLIGGLVWPDADVVGFLLQFDPVPHAEAPGHLARELNPARPVQRRVLACVQRGRAPLVGGRVPYRFGSFASQARVPFPLSARRLMTGAANRGWFSAC